MKFIIICLLLFCACGTYRKLSMMDLKIGMTKEQVITTIGRKPDNIIGAKQYSGGLIEVLQYTKRTQVDYSIAEQYWLYFWNDSLRQWGRPGDWEKEADRVYELRIR